MTMDTGADFGGAGGSPAMVLVWVPCRFPKTTYTRIQRSIPGFLEATLLYD